MKTAKTLPAALYHLAMINAILVIGLLVKELTLLYLIGSLAFVVMLILTVTKACNLWTVPDELISA